MKADELKRSDMPEEWQLYIGKLYSRILELEKQVQAYDEYVGVLLDELNDTVPMAHIHGWASRNVQKGIEARRKLNELGIIKFNQDGQKPND